jgi:hypothetical protein
MILLFKGRAGPRPESMAGSLAIDAFQAASYTWMRRE